MFTDPQLAHVGLNEKEASNRGIEYRFAKLPMLAVCAHRTLSEIRGFLKMLIGAHSNEILGFTAFGPDAGELMAVVQQTAMLGHMPFQSLRDAIFTHPTMAETDPRRCLPESKKSLSYDRSCINVVCELGAGRKTASSQGVLAFAAPRVFGAEAIAT